METTLKLGEQTIVVPSLSKGVVPEEIVTRKVSLKQYLRVKSLLRVKTSSFDGVDLGGSADFGSTDYGSCTNSPDFATFVCFADGCVLDICVFASNCDGFFENPFIKTFLRDRNGSVIAESVKTTDYLGRWTLNGNGKSYTAILKGSWPFRPRTKLQKNNAARPMVIDMHKYASAFD